MRLKAVRDNLKLFAQHRREQADERKADEARQELLKARQLYETWKTEMCKTGAFANQIVERFDAFKKVLKERVKNKDILRTIMAEVNFAEVKFLAVYGRSGRKPPQPPANPSSN